MTFPRPTAHWRLNGIPDDYSGNGHNGTWSNAGADAAYIEKDNGKIAADFDGASYISVPNNSQIALTDALTISCTFKLNSITGWQALVVKWFDGSKRSFFLWIKDGNVQFALAGPTGAADLTIYTGQTIVIGREYNLTLTSEGAGGAVHCYLDAEDAASSWIKTGAIYANNSDLYIGAYNNGTIDDYFCDGIIYEVRLYNVALTATQVKRLYRQPGLTFIPTQKTVAYNPDPSLVLATNDGLRDNSKNNIALTLTNCIPGNGKMVFTNGSLAFAAQTFTSYEYSYKASGSDRYIHYLFDGTNTYTNGTAHPPRPLFALLPFPDPSRFGVPAFAFAITRISLI